MTKEMVTIAEFYDLNAAYLLRSRLEAEGIPVFLQNEHVLGVEPPLAITGPLSALLQVPSDKVKHAMFILRKTDPTLELSIQEPAPSERDYRNGLLWVVILIILSALAGVLLFAVQQGR